MKDLVLDHRVINLTEEISILNKARFTITIPYIYTLSNTDLKTVGITTTVVNGVRTKRNENQLTTVNWPLPRIIQLFKEGYITMRLTGRMEEVKKETDRLYTTCNKLLDAYKYYGRQSIHNANVDNDYITAVECFAKNIYEEDQQRMSYEARSKTLGSVFSSFGFMQVDQPVFDANKQLVNSVSKYGGTPQFNDKDIPRFNY